MSEELTKKERGPRLSSGNGPTTTSKNEKRTRLQAGNDLKNNHPELFEILPLPGGYRQRSNNHRDSYHSHAEIKSREAKLTAKISPPTTTKLHAKDHPHIGEILQTNIRCPSASRPVSRDDQNNNTVRICSTAISTVMMLAQRTYGDITMKHVRHTEEYFHGLRQPDGYPENVGQLMQLLANLKENGNIVSSVNDPENDEEEENEKDQDYETEISD